MKPRFWQVILSLMGMECLVALVYTLSCPWNVYQTGEIVWTMPQVICAFVIGFAAIFFFAFLLASFIAPDRFQSIIGKVDRWLIHGEKNLVSCALFLILNVVCLTVCTLVFTLPEARFLHKWVELYLQVIPGAALAGIFSMQCLTLLFFAYPNFLQKKEYYSFSRIAQWVTIYLLLLVSLFHWAINFYQVDVFGLIPGWFWEFHVKSGDIRYGIWFLIQALLALLVWFILFTRGKEKQKLLLLMLAGFLLQAGYGFAAGEGFEALRMKFADSMHKVYAEFACDRPALLPALLNYEERYGWSSYLGTKPPGVLLVYVVTQKLAAFFLPATDFAGRFMNMTRWMSYVFPLISMIVLAPLYRLARVFLPEDKALYPLLLYIVSPNVILIPLFLDQVLYPLFFVCGIWLLYLLVKQRKMWVGFLCGIYAYTCLYFTFSMLPLIPLAVLWILLDEFFIRKHADLRKMILLLVVFGMGIAAAFFTLRWGVNFDIIQRYQVAMEHHHVLKEFQTGGAFLISAILLNQVDFGSWTGFSVCILAFVRFVRALIGAVKSKVSNIEILVISAFLTYGALNIFGQTRGEVGRIWLFMVPLVCLFAVDEIQRLFKRDRMIVAWLVILQDVATLSLFLFQDFFA